MGMDISYVLEESRLDITVRGNLDLTLTRQILAACDQVNHHLKCCVIDCRGVVQVFDSGLAVLMLLRQKLQAFEVNLIIIGDITQPPPDADSRMF